jgi:hypothetical protein
MTGRRGCRVAREELTSERGGSVDVAEALPARLLT